MRMEWIYWQCTHVNVCALCSFSFFPATAAPSFRRRRSFAMPWMVFQAVHCIFFLVFVSAIFCCCCFRFSSFFSSFCRVRFCVAVVVESLCFPSSLHIHTNAHALMFSVRIYVCSIQNVYIWSKQQIRVLYDVRAIFSGWAWPFYELWTVIGKLMYILYLCVVVYDCTMYINGYALHPPIQ